MELTARRLHAAAGPRRTRRRRATAAVVAVVLAAVCAPAVADEHPVDPRPQFGGLDSPIRPGSSLANGCTYNFVYYDSELEQDQDPVAYIGTAAHCTEGLGERATLPGGGGIGTVVYDSDLVGSGVDFSLIEIDAHLVARTNPTMRGWPGPTGSVTVADLTRGDVVDVYGYGMGVGLSELTRPRQGLLVNWTDDEYVIDMPAVNGDSGAPILQDRTGYALGIVSRYGVMALPPSTDVGPLMPYIFRELASAGFGDVVLATIEE